MRRFGLRRCARHGEHRAADVDLDEVRRADEELDALRSPEGRSSDDPVLHMLGALSADVDTGADAEKPFRQPAPAKRRLVSRAAVTTGLTAAVLSGTGVAAAAVVAGGPGPLRTIHYAVQSLYDRDGAPASTADVQAAIGEARSALAAGRLDDASRALHRAQAGWASMQDSRDARVAEAIHGVEARLARARQSQPEGSTLAQGSSHGSGAEHAHPGASDSSTAGESTSATREGSAGPASEGSGDQSVQPAGTGSSPSPSPSDRDGTCDTQDSGQSEGARAQDGQESGDGCRAGGGGQADDSAQSGGGRADDSAQSGGGRADDSAQPSGGTVTGGTQSSDLQHGAESGGDAANPEESGSASPTATS